MTEQEMWQIVKENNASYDGVFFYAVKTTGIYCRPSCKSKLPNRNNICFFENSADAKSAGFRTCKRCRSDLIDYQPMKEIALEVKKKIEEAYRVQCNLSEKLNEVGMSDRRLTDVFKEEYGMTPKAYADSLRLNAAKQLLLHSNERIIDVAYSVGFSSLSAFHNFFKKTLGVTPSAYRKSEGKCE